MWPSSREFCHDLLKGFKDASPAFWFAAWQSCGDRGCRGCFSFFTWWAAIHLIAADDEETAGLNPAARPVAASSAPSAPLPRVQKKVNDFGVPEVALINAAIQKGWSDHNLGPSKQATDGEWCRRVYLDLIGRVPTVEELTAYLSDHKNDKRERLVDSLLGDEVQRRVRAELDDDLDEHPHRPDGRERAAVARRSRGDDEVSQRDAEVQQAVRRDGAGADHGDGQLPAGRMRISTGRRIFWPTRWRRTACRRRPRRRRSFSAWPCSARSVTTIRSTSTSRTSSGS